MQIVSYGLHEIPNPGFGAKIRKKNCIQFVDSSISQENGKG